MRLHLLLALLMTVIAAGSSTLYADEKIEPVKYVKPIDWSRFKSEAKEDEHSERGLAMLQNAVRYNLGWMEKKFQIDSATQSYIISPVFRKRERVSKDFNQEYTIRPGAGAAFGVAVAMKLTDWDEAKYGCSKNEALIRQTKLIKGLAALHRTNSEDKYRWGDHWQSAHWTNFLGSAAWLLWDDLDAETQRLVANVVEHEADRFIADTYRVPYWANREKVITPNDTKAEENAWESIVLQTAVAMMPTHPHVQKWKTICTKLMVSSYAQKKDMDDSSTMIDGKPVKAWLDGYNIREDGFLVNHGRVHPDYMLSVITKCRSYMTQSLAGQRISQATTHNGPLVFRALTEHEWPAPPNKKPGGTCYIPGKAEVYYPQGTDWSNNRFDSYYRLDLAASILKWDTDSKFKAVDWMRLRAERILEMQNRHEDGHMFAEGEFTTYPLAEQQTAASLADGFLMQWLDRHDALSPVGNWLEEEKPSKK